MLKFSIIIPLYNKESTVEKTVKSILDQTYSNFELIIVDDGSKDNSLEIVSNIHDDRIRVVSKPNGGVSSARNRGIKESSSDWIAFFDADDIMYPYALEEYHKLIEAYPKYNVVATSYDQSNKKFNSSEKINIITDYDKAEVLSIAKSGFAILHTDCICMKLSCFKEVGLFNEDYTHGEDLDMWFRLAQKYPIAKSEKATALYIIGAVNNSLKALNKKYAPRAILETPRKLLVTKSQKQHQGCKVFHYILPYGIKAQPIRCVSLLLKYLDCVVPYAVIFINKRMINRS